MGEEKLKKGHAAVSAVCTAALCATMVAVPKAALAEEASQGQPVHQVAVGGQAGQLEPQAGGEGAVANADDAQDKHDTKFDFSSLASQMVPVEFNTSAVEVWDEVCNFLAYNGVLVDTVTGQPVPSGSLVPEDFEVTAADPKTKSVDVRFKGKDGYNECSATGVKLLLTGLKGSWNKELPSDGSGIVPLDAQFDFGITYDAPEEAKENLVFYFEEIDPETGDHEPVEGFPSKPGRYYQYVQGGDEDKGYEEWELEREFTMVERQVAKFNLEGRMIPVKYDPDEEAMLEDVCAWLADGQNKALIDAETGKPLTGFTEWNFVAFSGEGNEIQVMFKGSDYYRNTAFVPAKLYVTDLQLSWNEELPSGNVITQGQQFDFGVTLGAPDEAQNTLKVVYEDAGHNLIQGVPTEPGHYFQRATAGNEEAGYQETSIERGFTIVKGDTPANPKDPAKEAVDSNGNNDNADSSKASNNSQQTPKTSDYGIAFAGGAAVIAACAAAFAAFALRRRRG